MSFSIFSRSHKSLVLELYPVRSRDSFPVQQPATAAPTGRRGRQVTQGSLEPTGRRWILKVKGLVGAHVQALGARRPGEAAAASGTRGRNQYSLCVRLRGPGDFSRACGTSAFPIALGPRGFSLQPQPSARRGTRWGGPETRDAGRSPPSSARPGQHLPRSPARFVEGAMPALTAGLASSGLANKTTRGRSPADGIGLPLQGCLCEHTPPNVAFQTTE